MGKSGKIMSMEQYYIFGEIGWILDNTTKRKFYFHPQKDKNKIFVIFKKKSINCLLQTILFGCQLLLAFVSCLGDKI